MKTAKHTGSNLLKVIPIGSSGAVVLIQSRNHTACLPGQLRATFQGQPCKNKREQWVGILAPPLTSCVTLISSPASFEPPFL